MLFIISRLTSILKYSILKYNWCLINTKWFVICNWCLCPEHHYLYFSQSNCHRLILNPSARETIWRLQYVSWPHMIQIWLPTQVTWSYEANQIWPLSAVSCDHTEYKMVVNTGHVITWDKSNMAAISRVTCDHTEYKMAVKRSHVITRHKLSMAASASTLARQIWLTIQVTWSQYRSRDHTTNRI